MSSDVRITRDHANASWDVFGNVYIASENETFLIAPYAWDNEKEPVVIHRFLRYRKWFKEQECFMDHMNYVKGCDFLSRWRQYLAGKGVNVDDVVKRFDALPSAEKRLSVSSGEATA